MAIATTLLAMVVIAASPRHAEEVSMQCAKAVAHVLAYAQTERESLGNSAAPVDYESVRCARSRAESGRTYVRLIRAERWRYRDGSALYVVEPTGQVSALRGMPCEEHPTACE